MPRKSSLTYQESQVLSLAEEGTAVRVIWNDEGTVPWKKKKKKKYSSYQKKKVGILNSKKCT